MCLNIGHRIDTNQCCSVGYNVQNLKKKRNAARKILGIPRHFNDPKTALERLPRLCWKYIFSSCDLLVPNSCHTNV